MAREKFDAVMDATRGGDMKGELVVTGLGGLEGDDDDDDGGLAELCGDRIGNPLG